MTEPTIDQALTLSPDDQGGFSAEIHTVYSNGPQGIAPEQGRPFGGLLAGLAAEAMRQGLALSASLRTLSVQYPAAPRFGEPVWFHPRLLRGGRTMAFAVLEAGQGERTTLHATASFGADAHPEDVPVRADLRAAPPPLASLDPAHTISGPYAPWFTRHVEYVFDGPPRLMGANGDGPGVERVWMRTRDGAPLDTPRLCFLLDALYPPVWTVTTAFRNGASVDLRYDILNDPTPETTPGGWAFFEFRMLDLGGGWTMDDAIAWGADGTPLALSRQRRKLL